MSKKNPKNDDDSEPSLRETMRMKLRMDSAKAGKRTVSVMTRLSPEMVEILDNLAALGIFKSRADAVAAIVEKTLLSQIDSFDKLKGHVKKLDDIQGEAMDIALKALDGEN
ncbi:MAG: hypothetical protein ACXAAO_10120 [Candidatus Thorarchaeota archaeon]|jgi:Arc/MetJ-type ribon-helix-helix transcriptional regulator